MSSQRSHVEASRPRVLPDQGVLKALQALVDEQTRFQGQSVTSADERSTPQAWTMTETVGLAVSVQRRRIYGDFRPQPNDVENRDPSTSALQDLDRGLEQGMARMGRLLADPQHRFEQLQAASHGTYLGLRQHWHLNVCGGCGGAGRKTCYRCHGRCEEDCPRCFGRRRVACGCLNGQTTCGRCGGTSNVLVSYLVTTNVYNPNTGINDSRTTTEYRNERCPSCLCGQVTCTRCGGASTVTCPTCSGRGTCTCGTCSGQGKLRCEPCCATGKDGEAAHAVVTVTHTPQMAWNPGGDPWADEVRRSIGVNEVVALSESLSSETPQRLDGRSFQVVRHGVLPADRATARCGGDDVDAIAYGTPRRWWCGTEIVEHLLQRDVNALQQATRDARTSRWNVRLGGVLDALGNVTQSPAHTDIVARALKQDPGVPDGVSTAYAKTVQDAVSAGTLLVHRALGLDWALKVAVVMALVGGASWLVLGTVGAALVSGGIAALGVVLRHPVALRRLNGVYGSPEAAQAAQRLAGHDRGRSWGLAGAGTLAMVAVMAGVLPGRGPWQPAALRLPTWSMPGMNGSRTDGTAATPLATVAQALDARSHGRLLEARNALEGLMAQNVPGAAGALAWMTLQGEGQTGFAEGSPPQGMGDKSLRGWDAARLVAKAGGDAWAQATQGMLQLAGEGGAVRNERQGLVRLEQAAEHGATPAMVQLGRFAWRQHRPEQAQRWFQKAADAGDPQGMYDLGTLVWNQSSGRDSLTAHSWWDRAERQGGVMVHEPVLGWPAVARR